VKTKALFIITLLFSQCCLAQNETNNWLFGANVWINFSGGTPNSLTGSAMNVTEGCASFSDTSGNLLFYTNGLTIWDKNHNPMPNGTGMGGNNSSSQSAIVVPKPGSNYTNFYVFTVDADAGPNGLQYSEVDMTLNGGNGDVTAIKNIPLITPTSEKVTAVRHGLNVNDFWIITHEWNTDRFFTYLVTSAGVNTTPVISAVGTPHLQGTGGFAYSPSHGYMKASPDGSKIALAMLNVINKVDIVDFNNLTGQISNAVTISGMRDPYGLEFSPSGDYLYVAVTSNPDTIFQFDMLSANIPASKQIAATTPGTIITALQVANNGKIYAGQYNQNFLAVINDPNLPAPACGFALNAVALNSPCRQGLPNFFTNIFIVADYTYADTCLNDNSQFTLQYVGADSVLWNFDDPATGTQNTSSLPNPQHTFSDTGTYSVTCIVYDLGLTDTVVKTLTILPLPVFSLGNDTNLCVGQVLTLDAGGSGANSYLWSDLSTNSTLAYSSATTSSVIIWAEATLNGCVSRDSIDIDTYIYPVLNLGSDTTICGAPGYTLNANPSNIAGYTYLWQNSSSSDTFYVTTPGSNSYNVTVDNNGCKSYDTIQVTLSAAINLNLGADTSTCDNAFVTLQDVNSTLFNTYQWSTGATTSSISVNIAFSYTLTVTSNGCQDIDTINVASNNSPTVNLGVDSVLCEGEIYVLNAGNPGATYLWQDGTSLQTLQATYDDQYIVQVTQSGCTGSDTVQLTFLETPQLFPVTDTTICRGSQVFLDITNIIPGFTFQWSDGYPDPYRLIEDEGTYYATVTVGKCSNTSSYTVRLLDEPDIYLGEDTILCLGGLWTIDASFPSSTYLWQDGTTNPTYVTNYSNTFGVQVTNQCGVDVDSLKLDFVECNCFVVFPNAFTPNHDISNEFYNFKFDCLAFVSDLKIYNRWGMLVFESTDPEIGWNGIYKEKEAQVDVYVYVLKYTGVIDGVLQESIKRGTFLLYR
jgi:gliding motility-associated-like protein